MASEQPRLKGFARALGFFPGAILLGVFVCTGTASAQCGPAGLASVKNTACGTDPLTSNTTGANDSAFGHYALHFNTTGNYNTASGDSALYRNTTGHDNIGIGAVAGGSILTGSNNIDIGNEGIFDEWNTIRIGDNRLQRATYIAGISGSAVSSANMVCVSSSGQLGSARPRPATSATSATWGQRAAE